MLPTIAETIKKHGLRQKKSLGQHFLHHPELIEKIVRAAGNLEGRAVMEVGPGPGGLTRALLATKAARIIAIEKDSACIAALNELAAIDARLEIIEADALEITPSQLKGCDGVMKIEAESPIFRAEGSETKNWQANSSNNKSISPSDGVTIVANLPYNVGTLMLLNWLENIQNISSMTLMFQKEVVDRLLAKPREEAYGRLSVIAQFHCRIEKRFDIPPSAFLPPPKVVSTVVSLFPRPDKPADISPRILGIITKAAFGQRRKMLRSSLKSLGVPVEKLLADAGIDGSRRAEELSLNEFCAIARCYSSFIT